LASMLPLFFTASILSACCLSKSTCLSHDDLRELKTEFAIRLYQHVARAENRSSLVLSPASVAASLELLQSGAQGNTFVELRNALGYSVHGKALFKRNGFGSDCLALSSRGPAVQQACSLFVQAGVELSPRFAARWPDGSLQQANFSDPGAAAARIQQWISTNTGGGNVPSMTLETAASPLHQVAVVSTMYFKSTWQKKFSFMDTQMLPFTTAEGSTLKVPTMHHTAEVNYGRFQTASPEALSVLELPYVGDEISMLVLLPGHSGTALSRLESQLSAKAVTLWATSLKRTRMDVFLPR
ncbi:SERP3 protein, partial [Crypturellus undulatus]|nr:SERP3 protein [Crypturellus undulatus]